MDEEIKQSPNNAEKVLSDSMSSYDDSCAENGQPSDGSGVN